MARLKKSDAFRLLEKADKIKKTELKRSKIIAAPGRGDRLASGSQDSATWAYAGVPQFKWDLIFMEPAEFRRKYKMSMKKARELHG